MKYQRTNVFLSKRGFTRLQNVMIGLLAVILVSVGIYAFLGYNRSSYQVKANDTAGEVYSAAEKYFSILKSRGRLEDFNIKASHFGGTVNMGQQERILRSRYKGSDFEGFWEAYKEKYQDVPIYYIVLEGQDAEKGSREENPLLDMFEYQVLDDNIIKNTFLIEYNGNTGQVLNVIYSEKTSAFTYEGSEETVNNVILRDSKSLNRKWQGYYGMDLEELV